MDKEIIEILEEKLNSIKHGSITLTLYNGKIAKIETQEKISFTDKKEK